MAKPPPPLKNTIGKDKDGNKFLTPKSFLPHNVGDLQLQEIQKTDIPPECRNNNEKRKQGETCGMFDDDKKQVEWCAAHDGIFNECLPKERYNCVRSNCVIEEGPYTGN